MIDVFAFVHEKGTNEGIKDSIFTILESSIGKNPLKYRSQNQYNCS